MSDAVLVVEADATLRARMSRSLHLGGFAPLTVATWPEALSLLRFGMPVRFIFLGPNVPLAEGCSGPDVAHIPIVVLPADPWPALDRFTSCR